MQRRDFLGAMLAAGTFGLGAGRWMFGAEEDDDVDNPYAEVDWDACLPVHSMSHQHGEKDLESLQQLYDMGYRHFALSNYYPSAPTYPLPEAFTAAHPDVMAAPNAEHHSFIDSGLHANMLGSLIETGYGLPLSREQMAEAPIVARFGELNAFDAGKRPHEGVYRLDLTLESVAAENGEPPQARLTIDGGTRCAFGPGFRPMGEIREMPIGPGKQRIYFRADNWTVTARLDYDPEQLAVREFRLMQGSNRPWRDVFREALDGAVVDGVRRGGLLHADGGGVTLNHPTGGFNDYAAMLDFDPRVLGIEVWNVQTTGFGSPRGFYDKRRGPHLHFYNLWDKLLRSGRRCLGFFVKDHRPNGRGRNVLLLPDLSGMSMQQRERAALRAYRRGEFFGSIGAIATDGKQVVPPYDRTDFRFSRIRLLRSPMGRPQALEVAVAGHDAAKRGNVQIRFVTDQGVASVVDARQAEFPLTGESSGGNAPKYVRVEAFAFPSTHLGGEALNHRMLAGMNVYDISLLHDVRVSEGPDFFGRDQEFPARVPIVDMIFSQPIRFG